MRQRRFYDGELLRPLLHSKNPWGYVQPTSEEVEAIRAFLDRLLEVERYIKNECEAQRAILYKRVEEGDITDFEFQVSVDFHLKEGDPACLEDDDNMLVVITCVSENLLDSDLNWIEQPDEDYPLNDHYHPYLFHLLYCHMGIEHRDLLRIGHIWTDVDVVVQRRFVYSPK